MHELWSLDLQCGIAFPTLNPVFLIPTSQRLQSPNHIFPSSTQVWPSFLLRYYASERKDGRWLRRNHCLPLYSNLKCHSGTEHMEKFRVELNILGQVRRPRVKGLDGEADRSVNGYYMGIRCRIDWLPIFRLAAASLDERDHVFPKSTREHFRQQTVSFINQVIDRVHWMVGSSKVKTFFDESRSHA